MKPIPVRKITTSQVEHEKTGRFSIRDVDSVLNGQDLVHDLHRHDFYFVLALEKGKGTHDIDFVTYELSDHVVFILRPGQVHQLIMDKKCKGFLMEFDNKFYHPGNSLTEVRWKKASAKNYCLVEKTRFSKLFSLLGDVQSEYNLKQEGYAEAIKANLDLFFIELVRQSQNQRELSKQSNHYTQDRFEELLGLLENRIHEVKNVSQYADLLNLSVYQLNAITKSSVGKTASDLINDQIILEAKRHLLATPNQIKDIAWHLGYEDVSYFIRFFRKHTGHSPEAFRKNFK